MIIELSAHRPLLQRLLWQWLEALPLILFLTYVEMAKPDTTAEWRGPYILSALAAMAITAFVCAQRRVLHRVYLGLMFYFVSGALALLFRWQWLNEFYGRAEAAAMLFWIVGIGLAATLASSAGFVGVPTVNSRLNNRLSWLLVFVSVAVAAWSWQLRGDELLSAYLPFIVLLVTQGLLRAIVARNPEQPAGSAGRG